MLIDPPVLGIGDLAGSADRGAISLELLRVQTINPAGHNAVAPRRKAQELIASLRVHAARTRRRALPLQSVSVDVLNPDGLRAVEMTFEAR
jgi:hypothetical protein